MITKKLTAGDINFKVLAFLRQSGKWENIRDIVRDIEHKQHAGRLKEQLDALVKRRIILSWSELENELNEIYDSKEKLQIKFENNDGNSDEIKNKLDSKNKRLEEILKELRQDSKTEKTPTQILRDERRNQEIKRKNNYKITKKGFEKFEKIRNDCLDDDTKSILKID